jgi:hypothetical protein
MTVTRSGFGGLTTLLTEIKSGRRQGIFEINGRSAVAVDSPVVIARHSRPKDGVASLAYDRAIQYSETPVSLTSAAGYWMPRSRRGMTVER